MPLLPGKKNIGHNISEMEAAGHPHDQSVAAALRTALDKHGEYDGGAAAATTDTDAAVPTETYSPDGGTFAEHDCTCGGNCPECKAKAMFAELERYCQVGPNAGKPGTCPTATVQSHRSIAENHLAASKEAHGRGDMEGALKHILAAQRRYGAASTKAGIFDEDQTLKDTLLDVLNTHCNHAERRHTSFSEDRGLYGQDIFEAGVHRDKPYTPQHLDEMVKNFKQFSTGPNALVRVPAVLGHEETQEFLNRSDLPAAAWPSRIYRQGAKLKADFDDIPPAVKQLIKNKAYRTISSEVYDDPPDGVPSKGKMLRRIAFLGGDIPEIKTIDQINALTTPAAHSEGRFASYVPCVFKFREAWPVKGAYAIFSEVSPMNPEEVLAALAKHGVDTEALKGLPPESLAEMLRVLEEKDSKMAAANGDGNPGATGNDMAEPPDNQVGDENGLPDPKDEAESKAFAERARKMAETALKHVRKYCSKMDDMPASADATSGMATGTDTTAMGEGGKVPKVPQAPPRAFSEQQLTSMVTRIVEQVVAKAVKPKIDEFSTFAETHNAEVKRAGLERFCEAQRAIGKIAPYELDSKNPANILERLMRADAKTVVRKFKEGGKDMSLTELDLQKLEIEQRQPRMFSEQVKSAVDGQPVAATDRKQWAEATFTRFSETFNKVGQTRADFVKTVEKASDDTFNDLRKEYEALARA